MYVIQCPLNHLLNTYQVSATKLKKNKASPCFHGACYLAEGDTYVGKCYKVSPRAMSLLDRHEGKMGTKATSTCVHGGGLLGRFQSGWCTFILKHS